MLSRLRSYLHGTNSFNGQLIMANGQGVGVVVQDTGKYVEDLFGTPVLVAGPHDLLGNFDQAFCSAVLSS